MNKELQDKNWAVLTKEFKEEVKREFQFVNNEERLPHDAILKGGYSTMVLLFGIHNLISDAEGEEMLICEKSKVQEVYKTSKEIVNNEQYGTCQYSMHTKIICVLENLFGSKCLLDEEPKPSEPKYKVGDKVRISCIDEDGRIWNDLHDRIVTVKSAYLNSDNRFWIYRFEECVRDFAEGWLKPYTEPEKEDIKLVKNPDRRLTIAAMAMQGMLSNPAFTNMQTKPAMIVKLAVLITDKIISECEKKGGEK